MFIGQILEAICKTDSRPLMAREILEHSRPVQGMKFTSRIETVPFCSVVRLNYKLVTKPYVFNYHFCLHFFSKLLEGNIITGVCLFTGEVAWVSLEPGPFWGVLTVLTRE